MSDIFAVATDPSSTRFTRLLCCWDDPRIGTTGCLRKNCPLLHASVLYDKNQNLVKKKRFCDLFEVVPCNFAGMCSKDGTGRKGCSFHMQRYTSAADWDVPRFELEEAEAVDSNAVASRIRPAHGGEEVVPHFVCEKAKKMHWALIPGKSQAQPPIVRSLAPAVAVIKDDQQSRDLAPAVAGTGLESWAGPGDDGIYYSADEWLVYYSVLELSVKIQIAVKKYLDGETDLDSETECVEGEP